VLGDLISLFAKATGKENLLAAYTVRKSEKRGLQFESTQLTYAHELLEANLKTYKQK
jgi:hypothetical protein